MTGQSESGTAALFEEYAKNHNVNIRNEIVLRYMGLIKFIALSLRNVYSKYADVDDVVNEGVIALIGAVESFDSSRGVKFETYANLKIKGAIIDYVRRQDWIPRSVRKFSRDLDAAYNQLYNELGRQPANKELAARLSITEDKLEKNMADMAGTITLSFEELLFEDNFQNMSGGSETDKRLYEEEQKKVIAEAISDLKPKERQVVTLYYYEKLKFGEIAGVLGVSESRVCQIHSKAMLLLKRRLESYIKS